MSLGFIRPSSVWSRAAHRGLGLTASCRKPNLILSAGAHKKSAPSKPMPDPQKLPQSFLKNKFDTNTNMKSAPLKSKPMPYPPKAPDPEHIAKFQSGKVTPSDLRVSDHCLYWDTPVPTPVELLYADGFFRSTEHTSRKLNPSTGYNQLEKFGVPEIVFMCTSNGNKRLTLNWIFEQYLATSINAPGKKFKLVPYALGWKEWRDYKAVLVDTPGLAHHNQDERAQMFSKYLTSRKDPHVFLIINAEYGPKMQDLECLERLRRFRIPHQVVLNRADYVLRGSWEGKIVRENKPFCEEGYWNLQKRIRQVKDIVQPSDMEPGHLPGKGEIIAYGATQSTSFGINHLRWAVLQAANLVTDISQESAITRLAHLVLQRLKNEEKTTE